jgi:hypothetical protein
MDGIDISEKLHQDFGINHKKWSRMALGNFGPQNDAISVFALAYPGSGLL